MNNENGEAIYYVKDNVLGADYVDAIPESKLYPKEREEFGLPPINETRDWVDSALRN